MEKPVSRTLSKNIGGDVRSRREDSKDGKKEEESKEKEDDKDKASSDGLFSASASYETITEEIISNTKFVAKNKGTFLLYDATFLRSFSLNSSLDDDFRKEYEDLPTKWKNKDQLQEFFNLFKR